MLIIWCPRQIPKMGDLSVGSQFYQREIELISGGINTSKRGERLLVPVQRINIPTSGKHQSVECFDGLPERFDVVMHGSSTGIAPA